MSVTISSGGGGGITIETDPTALKIASNLSDLADPSQAIVNLGALGDAPNDGTVYGRQSGEWVTAGGGGGSFNGGTVANAVIADAGIGLGQAVLDPNYEGTPRVYVGDSGSTIYTNISPSGIQLSNLGISLTLNNYQIAFSDGSVQTTAYTGGGGSGTAVQQRYADAIATLVATPTYGNDNGIYVSAQWAFTCAYNNNSLTYEYPKFIDSISSEYAIAIFVGGVYLPLNYIDSTYITGWSVADWPIYDTVKFAVTSTVNGTGFEDGTTTAISFPTGIVNYSPA